MLRMATAESVRTPRPVTEVRAENGKKSDEFILS